MLTESEKMAQTAQEILKKSRVKKREEEKIKQMAIGQGMQRAIKEGLYSWDEIKKSIDPYITNKKQRFLLKLEPLLESKPKKTEQNFFNGHQNKSSEID